jgi:hypothetical protein
MKVNLPFRYIPALLALVLLAGCEQLGIEDPAKLQAAKDAEGKAIGSACRHAVRAIEDCYALNPRANKASMFAGWREMDEYMRENKMEGVIPVVSRTPVVKPEVADAGEDKPKAEDKPADKTGEKSSGKALAKAKPAAP